MFDRGRDRQRLTFSSEYLSEDVPKIHSDFLVASAPVAHQNYSRKLDHFQRCVSEFVGGSCRIFASSAVQYLCPCFSQIVATPNIYIYFEYWRLLLTIKLCTVIKIKSGIFGMFHRIIVRPSHKTHINNILAAINHMKSS